MKTIFITERIEVTLVVNGGYLYKMPDMQLDRWINDIFVQIGCHNHPNKQNETKAAKVFSHI